MGQGAEVWKSVLLRDTATVQGELGNGRPVYALPEAHTSYARILDGDKLQVAVFQQVNLIDGIGDGIFVDANSLGIVRVPWLDRQE